MSLIGVTYFSVFYSKDAILESLSFLRFMRIMRYRFLVLGCVLTSVDSIRLFSRLLGFEKRGKKIVHFKRERQDFFCRIIILSFFKIRG